MNTKRFKAGVVGCGRSGSLFDSDKKRSTISSHCGAYKNHPKTILKSICDQDEIKLLNSLLDLSLISPDCDKRFFFLLNLAQTSDN